MREYSKDKIFYVYRYIRLDTNTPFYVGKGKNNRANRLNKHNKYCVNIITKYGVRIELIFKDLTEEEAFKKEIELISLYKKFGYCEANIANGGEGASGRIPSQELRNLLSSYYKGKPRSKEIVEKISKSHTGSKRSPQAKLNIKESKMGTKNARFGTTHNPETLEKMSQIKMGENNPMFGLKTSEKQKRVTSERQNKKVIDILTGFVWESCKEAAYIYDLNVTTLSHYLIGKSPNKTSLRYIHLYEGKI